MEKKRTKIISFESGKNKIQEHANNQKILAEIKQKQMEMTYYEIGNKPSTNITNEEYVTYLIQDIGRSSQSYFWNRWLNFLNDHPEIKVADLMIGSDTYD